jgi:hypothetical protein
MEDKLYSNNMNYEEDIRIDESALDVEWLDQPSLMMKYARNAAEARLELDRAKEALELAKAELDREVRSNPEAFGMEKLTESAVQNTIILQEAYIGANDNFIQAKFKADIAQGAVRAFDARKDALENLGRLLGLQYFAGPKMPRDLLEEREQRNKELNVKVGNKMSRRTK